MPSLIVPAPRRVPRVTSLLLGTAVAWLTALSAVCRAGESAANLPPLPEPISSFGASIDGTWLYVYSGHTGKAHAHSKRNLSQRFQRLNLASSAGWESLPFEQGLQSVALVAHGKQIYRVGGLSALNEPNEEDNLVSVRDFARFDPKTRSWTALTPLPEGRSSHDAVVAGDKLYVVGGWNLGETQKWHSTGLVLDLADPKAAWTELPKQPFERRALAVAEVGGKLYAIGGMNSHDEPSLDVHYLDLKKNEWAVGPSVPAGKPMNGFGCSAFGVDGTLYLSTMDGQLHRLARDGSSWESVAKLQTPRFFHRLLPYGKDELLAIGGASPKGHLDSIERIVLGGAQ